MNKYIIAIIVMVACFLISGLFFLNTGVLGDDGQGDEQRLTEIIYALDDIPFVYIDADEIEFHMHGTIQAIDDSSITLQSGRDIEVFDDLNNTSAFAIGDRVVIEYHYNFEGDREIWEVRRFR